MLIYVNQLKKSIEDEQGPINFHLKWCSNDSQEFQGKRR